MPTTHPTSTFEEAARWFVALIEHIEPHAWRQPALGVWDVQLLVGHTARALIATTRALGKPATTAELTHPIDYLRWSLGASPQAIVDRAAATAAALGDAPIAAVAGLADEAIAAVAQASEHQSTPQLVRCRSRPTSLLERSSSWSMEPTLPTPSRPLSNHHQARCARPPSCSLSSTSPPRTRPTSSGRSLAGWLLRTPLPSGRAQQHYPHPGTPPRRDANR